MDYLLLLHMQNSMRLRDLSTSEVYNIITLQFCIVLSHINSTAGTGAIHFSSTKFSLCKIKENSYVIRVKVRRSLFLHGNMKSLILTSAKPS